MRKVSLTKLDVWTIELHSCKSRRTETLGVLQKPFVFHHFWVYGCNCVSRSHKSLESRGFMLESSTKEMDATLKLTWKSGFQLAMPEQELRLSLIALR